MEAVFAVAHNVFWFLVMLTAVVFIHEFGHYIVARLCGVRIETFSIGFGKEIFGWNDKTGTRWKISWLPFGGYVKMFGDADAASMPDFKRLKGFSKKEKRESFYFKTLWQKALVVFAGPAFNYVLAICIMTAMFALFGKQETAPEVTFIKKDSPAEQAGLQTGDLIVQLDGSEVGSFEEIKQVLSLGVGGPLKIQVRRNDTMVDIIAWPIMRENKDNFGNIIRMPELGIGSNKYQYKEFGLFASFTEAVRDSYRLSVAMLKTVGQMITGSRGVDQLGGPIKIAQYSGHTAAHGAYAFLWFIALISINLGLVNLFPIPMLDGGHLVYYLIEAVRGKPVTMNIQIASFRIGFALLMILMAFVTYNDIYSLLPTR